MRGEKTKGFFRTVAVTTGVPLILLLMIELTAWILDPDRYKNPPAVTVDAWIHSDGLTGPDTLRLKLFVDEFCRSYTARWTPYLYFRREPFSGKLINIDSNGVRYTPQFRVFPENGRRIPTVVLLGGSTVWGTGAGDSATIPATLARLIASNPDGAPMRVVNMGESGYVNTQSLLSLELELRRGNVPDHVIIYDGINDIFSAYQNNEAGLPQNEQNRVREFNLLQDGSRMRGLGVSHFWQRTVTSGIVTKLRELIHKGPPVPILRDHLPQDVVRLYRGNLGILDALSRQYGFQYSVYWQPVVFSKRDPSHYEESQIALMEYVRPFFLEAYRLVAADSALKANPHFHNLSDLFDGMGAVYLDFCHVTERGNGIVARRLYEDLFRNRGAVL